MIYTYNNLSSMPNQNWLDDNIRSNLSTYNLVGIDLIDEIDENDITIYTINIEFEEEIITEDKTTLDNLVQQSLNIIEPIQDTDVILKNIYDNVTSQEQSMRLLTTFNTYPIIKSFLDNYNYDMAWLYLNQAKIDGILTEDDITYLQQYIPTGDW